MERNKPYLAFDLYNSNDESVTDYVQVMSEGTELTATFPNNIGMHLTLPREYYLVPKTKVRTLYDGRYCAVSGFIFAVVDGKYSVLANLRGQGTPDYQGCWNCPCGFLERNEDSKTGIAREIKEECGVNVDTYKLKVVFVETDPEKCNNGNVTIRHRAFIGHQEQFRNNDTSKLSGGEQDEVDNIRWIPVEDIDKYRWAFHHEETIREYGPKKWIRRIAEFVFK